MKYEVFIEIEMCMWYGKHYGVLFVNHSFEPDPVNKPFHLVHKIILRDFFTNWSDHEWIILLGLNFSVNPLIWFMESNVLVMNWSNLFSVNQSIWFTELVWIICSWIGSICKLFLSWIYVYSDFASFLKKSFQWINWSSLQNQFE